MSSLSPKKVLVIEDDDALLSILRQKISENGFDVIEASDGNAGLSLAINNNPDLILLDLQLPKLNGKDLLKKVRDNEGSKSIPVIILTNDSSDESMNDASSKGSPAYFIKSETSLATIVEAVQLHLASSP